MAKQSVIDQTNLTELKKNVEDIEYSLKGLKNSKLKVSKNLEDLSKKELEDFIQFAYLKFRGPKWGMQRLFNDFRYTQKIHGIFGAIKVPPLTIRLFVSWFREKSRGRTFDNI